MVLRNQIPKAYLPYDLYCNLIPNEDENVVVFDQVPRTGSFEVSYKGLVSHTADGGYKIRAFLRYVEGPGILFKLDYKLIK